MLEYVAVFMRHEHFNGSYFNFHKSKPRGRPMNRRDFAVNTTLAATAACMADSLLTTRETKANTAASTGKLKQGFCSWCFKGVELEAQCEWANKLGMPGIDLLGPDQFETLKKHNLVCTMVTSHPLSDGLCDPKYHASSLEAINTAIEATAKEGWRNVICFSGNARGIDRETGMNNCVEALKKIVTVAEKNKVILNMELLNSRVDHADYMCDRSDWGIELCKRVGSDNFKLLFDIYHMQIMEGDIIRSIQKNHKYFGHYHTAGNPGRNELDQSQEIYYPPIAKAISEVPYDGYFVHEFIPTRDAFTGLKEATEVCLV
jgi:hydroxypyruvate isomerase